MTCFTHTHAGPNVSEEPGYLAFANAQVLAGVDQALASLTPVRAAWGVASGDIGVNRRNPEGLLDRRIGVLKIVDAASGQLRLLLLRLTAHANVLSSDNYFISPDFIGAARDRLCVHYGCPVVITQGASGNVRPRYQHSLAVVMEERPGEAAEVLARPGMQSVAQESLVPWNSMAAAIDAAVADTVRDAAPRPISRVELFSETHTFYADVPTMERAREIAPRRAARLASTASTGSPRSNGCTRTVWQRQEAAARSSISSRRRLLVWRGQRGHCVRSPDDCGADRRPAHLLWRLHQRLRRLSAHGAGIRPGRLRGPVVLSHLLYLSQSRDAPGP
jgi:hypothetical protein